MKKIVASVGLVALGAASIQSSASAQSVMGGDTSKPWSVSAILRGFYDSNVATLPNDEPTPPGQHRETFGFEIAPSVALKWALQQTTIDLGFLYSFKHYENTPIGSTGNNDQTFTFNGDISHSFSENVKVRASDGFVIGQEPDTLRAGNAFATFQRISGDNIRNYGSLGLDAQITPVLGGSVGYDNGFYDYSATGPYKTPQVFLGVPVTGVGGSPAGVLNRIENTIHLEGLYAVAPETKALLGYSFSDVSYTGDEFIGGFLINPAGPIDANNLFLPVKSWNRNYRQHRFYVGAEHNFTPELTGNIRAGASYVDYYNDPTQSPGWTPYVTADIKYTYAPDSYVDFGFSYDISPTDVVGLNGVGSYTTSSDAAVVFATVNHRITPQLFGTLTAQFQNNDFNGGIYNNTTEQYYLVGLDFEYRFNQYFAGHVGYNFDYLYSPDIGRTYDRNRVYIGVSANY